MSNKIEFILNKNKQYLECELTHTCITLHIMFILKENIYVNYHYILFSLFLENYIKWSLPFITLYDGYATNKHRLLLYMHTNIGILLFLIDKKSLKNISFIKIELVGQWN